jgi:hypothetical protein
VAQLPGDEARSIKAYAYLRMDQYDEAFKYLASDDPLRVAAGWISRAPEVKDIQPNVRKSLVEGMQAAADHSAEQEVPETATSLLERSAGMRSTIANLMRD